MAGQTVGELFVELGIKGADKTVNSIGEVTSGLGSAKGMALETKAAVLGAIYAFEQMVAKQGALGTNLTNFTALTDIPMKIVQQWTWAVQRVGGSMEDIMSSFKSFQAKMGEFARTGAHPDWMARLLNEGSNLGIKLDLKRATKDVPYGVKTTLDIIEKGNLSAADKQAALSSFGFSGPLLLAEKKNYLEQGFLDKAPVLSDSTVAANNQSNIAFGDVERRIQREMAKMNAEHGSGIAHGFDQLTKATIGLVNAFDELFKKFHVFSKIAGITNWAADSIEGATIGVKALGGDKSSLQKVKEEFLKEIDLLNFLKPTDDQPDLRLLELLNKVEPAPVIVNIKQMPGSKDKFEITSGKSKVITTKHLTDATNAMRTTQEGG